MLACKVPGHRACRAGTCPGATSSMRAEGGSVDRARRCDHHRRELNFGSSRTSGVNCSRVARRGDQVGLDFLAGERVDLMHLAIEHHRADHFLGCRVESLAQGPQGDLGADTLIDLPDVGNRPGRWLDYFAGFDVPECLVFRDDIGQGQVPLDSQQGGFGYISGSALRREPGWIRGTVQHYLDVLADSMPVVLAESGRLQFVDMRIVSADLALSVGNLPVMRLASLDDLPALLRFAALVIGLGVVECSPGLLAGSLITPLEHSRRFRFEVRPLRSRDRYHKLS
jgi:hypothetical protein